MTRKLSLARLIPVSFAFTALLATTNSVAQSEPARETKGVEISQMESLDLAPWAEDAKGRELRIRKFVLQPGGTIAVHSHDDRPDASYLAQGELTEYRVGGQVNHRPGDTVHLAGKGLTHWVVNEGNVPAVLVVVDLFKP